MNQKNSCAFEKSEDGRAIIVHYHGVTYPTLKAFCEAEGVKQDRLVSRLRAGMDFETAVEAPPLNCMITKDHKGNTFSSLAEMARFYKIPYRRLYRRLFVSNLTVEQALELPFNSSRQRCCFDHEGNVFASAADRATFWKKEPGIVKNRLAHGWSVKRALTEPLHKTGRPRKEK